MSLLDWGKLIAQGRAKAHGVSWSNVEMEALTLLCKAFNKSRAEMATYVRAGILTVEDYNKEKGNPGVVNPFLTLSKEDLIKKAKALEISISPDATKEVLADLILKAKTIASNKRREEVKKEEPKEGPKEVAKPKAKPKAKAKAKPKTKN